MSYAINYGLRRSTNTAYGDISANTIQILNIKELFDLDQIEYF